MSTTEASRKANRKYKKEKMKAYTFRLTRTVDADIISQLDRQQNRQRYLKNLIRNDIKSK